MRRVRSRALIALVAALAATLALTGAARAAPAARAPALVPIASDGLSRALARGAITEAQYALARARALFHPAAVAARYGTLARPDPRDATLVLRDLAVRAGELSPAERALARRILARPDDGSAGPFGPGYSVPSREDCTPNVCVHWVDSTADAPAPADSDADTIPDYVELTETVMEEVWSKEVVQYGYRAPKSDLSSTDHGPDARIDVYLADVGDASLYGYCTTDDPALVPSYQYGDASAYCVLDNDFSPTQFPGPTTQTAALEVTAAHEFFHAVQFAYDIYEDAWLMEGTAVWMEDEVYDAVDDNYQYLRTSALRRPSVPLDLGVRDFSNPLAGFQYGAFVFWRFLEETFATPEVIRRVWELADDTPGAADEYSLQAVESMLEEQGTSLGAAFALFGAVNVSPGSYYAEGAAYPTPPAARLASLTATRTTASGTVRLDHLTTWYAVLRPGASLRKNARLRVELDLPPRARGAEASLVVLARSGAPRLIRIPLDQGGRATRTVAFGRAKVASVVLVLTNASGRLDCWHDSDLSCHGTPLDDRLPYSYAARAQ
jgi:hypothetical protein